MTELIYVYNILLIIFYSITMAISIYIALKENSTNQQKKIFFLVISVYLLFFIFDNLVLSMTEIISDFGHQYNQFFLGVPIIKTIVFLVNNFCQLWIVMSLRNEKLSVIQYLLIVSTFLWMLLPFMESSALRVYLYYLPNQLLLIYTGFVARKNLEKIMISTRTKEYLRILSYAAIFFGLMIIIEDTFVIFNLDSYNIFNLKIQNRNFSEDLFSITICCLIFRFLIQNQTASTNEKIAQSTPEQPKSSITRSDQSSRDSTLFFQHYHLTEREQEIFELLLQHKNNQEIADILYLSVGTVKTHIHNIFLKLEINKRNQIFEVYEQFSNAN